MRGLAFVLRLVLLGKALGGKLETGGAYISATTSGGSGPLDPE